MPPKGRPRRTNARKSVPPPQKLSSSTAESNPPITDSPPPNAEEPESKPQPTEYPPPNAETLEDKTQPEELETTTIAQNGVVLASSSETIGSADEIVKEVVMVDDARPIESDINEVVTDNNSNSISNGDENGGKPKKMMKKTVKVVRKVIKKVPKKVVKPEVGSKGDDELDKAGAGGDNNNISVDSNISANVNAQESASGAASDELKLENHGLVLIEEEENNKGEVEVDGGLEEVGCGSVELKQSEVDNNVDDVEVSRKEGEKEKEKVREGEEGKLFRGELEAMERRKRRKTEVFVGGLDKDTKEEDVRNVFAEAGEIVDLRVVTRNKSRKKFAFLRFACAEDAKRALDKFAKVKICGKECGATPVEGNDTIYLGNIDKKWKDEDVVKLLNKIGIDKIDKVTVKIDPNNSDCNRGFAFVEFESIRDAQVAYSKLQEKDVFGKNQKLKVAWAEPLKELDEEEMSKVKTVYAEFIPASWDEEKVRDIFKKFGEIDDIVLARNLRTSKRKDFAFISYQTRVAAIKCIESFEHEFRDGDGTKANVKVSLAKPVSKGKNKQVAKPVSKEVPRASSNASHSKHRPSETRNRTHPSIQRYGIHNPAMSSTNVELVRLLREQASWRPPQASLSNSSMDIHNNPLSGRKRQFSLLETDPLSGELNRYPHSRLDDRYSVASSSRNVLPPNDPTNPMAYHQQHSGYPFGSHYGARNYASNIEIRDRGHARSFLHRPY